MSQDFATEMVNAYEHRQERFERDKTELMNRLASALSDLMWKSEEAKAWRDRLEKLGIQRYYEELELGYVPAQRNWLRFFLEHQGYSPRFLEALHFLRMAPTLCGDAVLPVRDASGNVVSFAVLDARLFAAGHSPDTIETAIQDDDVPF